ncbi:conserved hypothetical protein [Neospora caninum Liverpool]|uniref:Uncharacterized protein n=1 Tax=Neospora caninum (strain Liverpool) TaxID=572307 RepID=F0VPN0_NEOCL|nr:conserved hypothetical protein [Neospora caninum Liverpool]CBZ55677.1 conserved hypothetical protein [Neospora caninum Liverpool]CEL70419.1 TPA: hypothetical protein BN1204_061010 [Neospora caninum Liverpool]|eukprot:XP_003885703.1 conserved hypothetical protein [Neospora caninum Liverpool]
MADPDTLFAHHGHSINFETLHYVRLTHKDDLLFAPQGDTDTTEVDDDNGLISRSCVSNWYAPADKVQEGTTIVPASVRFDQGDEVTDTEKSGSREEAVVSRGESDSEQPSRFVVDSSEAPFAMPSLQDLPSRSVAGILQWYRAASKELSALHRHAEEGDKSSCEPKSTSQEPQHNVVGLPSQRALVAHQRELLIDLASSTAVVFEAKERRGSGQTCGIGFSI